MRFFVYMYSYVCELSHLLMGFELQLYEPADYAMIYWCINTS
jgi:hypothetical protein